MSEPRRGESVLAEAEGRASEGGVSAREDSLEKLREEIDRVDRAILELLNQRARVVHQVGEEKRAAARSIYHAGRERDLVEALQASNPGPFPNDALPAVFREIVSATRSLELAIRVAFLGPEGTFSQQAAQQTFGQRVELFSRDSITEVFAAVDRGEVEHGIVPVENTTEGVVTQTLDAFVETPLPICGETLLPVSQSLLGRASDLDSVRLVASKPEALAQCRQWLDRNLSGAERLATASTAAAAAMAAEDASVAAVGSALLGELHGLRTLAEAIQDRQDNTTRFLVIGGEAPEPTDNDLTSVIFTVRKAQAGALHDLLAPFAEHGVNLTSIQSRPLAGAPWEYLFFVDLEGHRSDPAVARALEAADHVANSTRVLGSFPRAPQVSARRGGR